MRLFAILLIWPVTVFGDSSPDALPAWGLWKCQYETAVECEWKDHSKLPECELEDITQKRFGINLETSPKTISFPVGGMPIRYIGPGGDAWTLVHKDTFFDSRIITILSPSDGKFRQAILDTQGPNYSYVIGTCTNITPKEPEKPTEGDAKEKVKAKD
jgi:hypothetical protein